MKCLNLIAILILISPAGDAKVSESRRSIRGTVEVEKGTKEGGELFLTISSVEGSLVPVALRGGKKETLPPDNIKVVSLGRFYGRSKDFSFLLKKGTYQVGCIVKRVDPPCKEITRNGEKRIASCFPTKDDFICAGAVIEVNDRDLDSVKIQLGLPEEGAS